jgi:ribosome-binding protein aMBF1 (putative translation factor)
VTDKNNAAESPVLDFRDDLAARLRNDRELADAYAEAHERASLGLRLARLRADRGLSQSQLAERLNTTQSVISRYESADYANYNLTTLRRLATALDADLSIDLRAKPNRR